MSEWEGYKYIELHNGSLLFYIESNPDWFDMSIWPDGKYWQLIGKDKSDPSNNPFGFEDCFEEQLLYVFYECRNCCYPDFNLLGVLSEITEEQILFAGIAEGNNGDEDDTMWRKYNQRQDTFFLFTCPTPKESLLSLLKSENIDTSRDWVLILKK